MPLSVTGEAEVSDLLNCVRALDAEYERYVSPQTPVLGLQIILGFPLLSPLLLKHFALRIERFSVREYVTQYDHFILAFPELLSIRAVRFSGEIGKVSEYSSLLLERFQRKREKGKLELEGSFITMGRLSNVDASLLQMLIPLFLALIRPLSKDGSIFPSPLSFIAHELSEGGQRKVYLSPCSLTAILEKEKVECKERFPVLGNRFSGFLVYGKALTYKSSSGEIGETSLKVFVPIHEDFDERFKEYPRGTRIAHLLGMFVFEEGLPVLKPQRRGYFLALQEIPFLPEVEAMAIHGEPLYLAVRTPQKVYEYCYAIESSAEKVDAFVRSVNDKISKFRRRGAYSAVEELTLGSLSKEVRDLFKREGGVYKLVAPPLLALAVERASVKDALNEVSKILGELQKLASLGDREAYLKLLLELRKSPLARRVLNVLRSPWKKSFEIQKEYAMQHNLEYLI
ncbi:MAG: hypothetical protein LM576_01010 [Thermofilum sp.]|nr:hypothetical protein [Thermofilum sp.]